MLPLAIEPYKTSNVAILAAQMRFNIVATTARKKIQPYNYAVPYNILTILILSNHVFIHVAFVGSQTLKFSFSIQLRFFLIILYIFAIISFIRLKQKSVNQVGFTIRDFVIRRNQLVKRGQMPQQLA